MFPATLTRDHGNVRRILIVALATLMLFATLAVAPIAQADEPINENPDGFRGPGNNQVSAWCVDGYKDESPSDPFRVPSPGAVAGVPATAVWTLLVLKAGSGDRENAYWNYPTVGALYSHPDEHANSHIILCWEEQEPELGTIIVEKLTLPNGDQTGFAFTGDAAGTISDGQQIVVNDLDPGQYTSTEIVTAGWDLTGISCDTGASGDLATNTATFNIVGDETLKCTFTNTKQQEPELGTIIVEKLTLPNGDQTGFAFTGDAAGTISDGQQIVVNDLDPGQYTSTEIVTAGWDLTGISCDTGASGDLATNTATFNIVGDETLKCTFTNTKQQEPEKASLTIIKTAVNGDDTFEFLSAELGDFPIATSGGTGSEPFTNLDAGTYHVAEDVTALGTDWEFITLTCEGAIVSSTEGAAATVELAPGDDATCTFTNIYDPEDEPGLAQLKLVKEVDGGSAVPNDWTLFAATDEEGVTDLDDFDNLGGAGVFEDVYPNVGYTLSESAGPANYIASNWSCEAEYLDDVQTSGDLDPFTLEGDVVTLDPYARVVCTITNTYNPPPPPRLANLTIMKESFGGDDTFDFLGGSLGDFSITTVAETGSKIFTGLSAGTYVVAEDLDALFDLEDEWFFLDLVCDADQQTIDLDNAEATVYLAAGDSVTCTFTNELEGEDPPVPGIDIEKATNTYDADLPDDPDVPIIVEGDTVTWTYDVTNTGGVDLYDVEVTDDKEGAICTIDELLVGETKQCTKTGTAGAADYGNVATATDGNVTDTDPSNYKGLAFLGTAQLGDTVWLDANNNGIQDNGEVGYNGAKVILTDADGNVVATLVTATGAWVGFYKFLELDADTYTATLDLTTIGDYGVTTAKSFTVTLAEGDDYLKADFGLYKAPAEETLPKTGTDSEALALFALGLLMMGGLAVLSTRKRRIEER